MHALALSGGQLSVVQPLLVSGLLYALPLSRVLERRQIRLADLGWTAAVVGGLAMFLLTAHPARGQAVAHLNVLLAGAAATVVAICLGLGAVGRWPRHRAAWFGFCAGAGYGLFAALLKTSVGALARDGTAVLASWPLYALAVIGAGAVAINQVAFRVGPLASSLPLITIADPVVAVIIGATAFGEETASTPALLTGQIGGFALISVGGGEALAEFAGVLYLARRA